MPSPPTRRRGSQTLLYLYWLERYDAQFALPPTYADLEPGDVVTVSADSGTHTVRLTRNHLRGRRPPLGQNTRRRRSIRRAGTGESGGAVSGTIVRAGPTVYELLDLPRCLSGLRYPQFVVALGGQSAQDGQGRRCIARTTAGSTWSIPLDGTPPGAVIGVTANALAAHPGTQIDSASALAITLYSGDLESVSQLARSAAPIILPTAPPTAGR